MIRADEYTDLTGLVPFQSKDRHTIGHVIRPEDMRTACGLYGPEDMISEATLVSEDLHTCGRCRRVIDRAS